MRSTRELLAEYVVLLNKHGVASHEEMTFCAGYANQEEFQSLAKIARKLKEYFNGDVSWLEGPLARLDARVSAVEARDTAAETALRLIEADPHDWSKRPCQTCRGVSMLLKRPFGCEAKAGRV
jgi:hypothetical protein